MMKRFIFLCLGWIWFLPYSVWGGVVADAPPLTAALTKILNALLILFGSIAIIGMIIVGIMYFRAGGDKREMIFAKRSFATAVTGIVLALGSMVLVWAIAKILT